MTQLTFNQKSAFSAQKSHRSSISDDRAHERSVQGNADAYMARVSRNSLNGRRRHGSEQPDTQRNIRPRVGTEDISVPRGQQDSAQSYTQTVGYEAGYAYPGVPLTAHAVTTTGHSVRQAPIETKSPESYNSPSSSTIDYTVLHRPSLTSSNENKFPSAVYTPSHSVSSPFDTRSQDSVSAFFSLRAQSGSSLPSSNEDGTLRYGVFYNLRCCFLAICSNLTRCR